MTPVMCCNWVVHQEVKEIAVVVRDLCRTLAQQGTYFALYTTPTPNPDKAQYVGLDEQVFTVFAKTIAAGFDLGPELKQTTMHISLIKSTMYTFLEKKRAEFNKKHGKASSAASAKDFKNEIKKNPYFRRNEHSL
uniref:Uncharacterized protein n=1 Tax=Caenorhabditis japonica TaxID=281687 RepID=A0A8R1DFJ3_CAEJA